MSQAGIEELSRPKNNGRRAPASSASADVNPQTPRGSQLERILSLWVPISVTLCEREITIESLLNMSAGIIMEFGVPFDAELKLCVGDRVIAYGQAVKVGERYGLRITRIESVFDRIDALNAHAD